jgi:hypothetical protein
MTLNIGRRNGVLMSWMKQFLYDMIHMTEGEKLISYWPLWLGMAVVIGGSVIVLNWKKH